jgi:hypothetical protein
MRHRTRIPRPVLLRAAPALLLAQAAAEPVQDTVRVLAPHGESVIDSVALRSPLPDPFVPVVQWIFQKPPWLMLGGLLVAFLLAATAAFLLWRHRSKVGGALGGWFAARRRGVLFALAGGSALALLAALVMGWKTYDYVMHDNDFCRGCHIFVPSGQVVERPDTGSYLLVNAVEGPHQKLECHACHPFEIEAQTKEFVAWITERPEAVPPHAKVPRETCEGCHVTGEAKETWQRIAATAGHRVHLESDSLQGRGIECLTCHARTAHRFAPADSTCGQANCHVSTEIRLAGMRSQTDLHCSTCHAFTADVPALATRDSARGHLVPTRLECTQCHEMRRMLADFRPERDPHLGTCGMCHNPHEQETPQAARKTCATEGCHADWRDVPFHVGAAHRDAAAECTTCHVPHDARVDASNCAECHEAIRERTRLRPPVPFDTAAAVRRSVQGAHLPRTLLREPPRPQPPPAPPPAREPRGKGDVPPADPLLSGPPLASGTGWRGLVPTAAADSFEHERHRSLACIVCHTTSRTEGALNFEVPRGCQLCHHQNARRQAAAGRDECARCHQADELVTPYQAQVQVAVEDRPPRVHTAGFSHERHAELVCTTCHTTPVTLEPAPAVAACSDCHDEHHTERRQCAECHQGEPMVAAHRPVQAAHQDCDACHAEATVARLTPDRSFCATCHEPQREGHHPSRECTTCHFLTSPEGYRPQLTQRGGG